jgi:predicted ribosomally synthesized peptide with nif11-like leader
MSIESAQNFLERMKTDEDFKKKISGASGEEQKKIITQAGFDFTDEELDQVSGELDFNDLEEVAGGADCSEHHCQNDCDGLCFSACSNQACDKEKVCTGQCTHVY